MEALMGVPFEACVNHLNQAVEILFDADPQIQAVGIARHEQAFGFKAVKNAAKGRPRFLEQESQETANRHKKNPSSP